MTDDSDSIAAGLVDAVHVAQPAPQPQLQQEQQHEEPDGFDNLLAICDEILPMQYDEIDAVIYHTQGRVLSMLDLPSEADADANVFSVELSAGEGLHPFTVDEALLEDDLLSDI